MAAAACQPWNRHEEKTVISGQLAKHPESTLWLSQYSPAGLKVINSCLTDASGSFRMSIRAAYPDVYRLSVASNNFTDIIAMPGDRIRIVAGGLSIRSPLLAEGSPETDTLLAFDRMLLKSELRLDSLRDQAVLEPDPVKSNTLLNESLELKSRLKAELIDSLNMYAKKNQGSLLPLVVMTRTFDDESLCLLDHDLESVGSRIGQLQEKYFGSRFFRFAETQARDYCLQKLLWEIAGNALRTGMKLPEENLGIISGSPSFPGVNSHELKLIWFWQSGCSHCREESEALLTLYKEYHPEGFEIFSIALDEDEGKVRQAIRDWKIPWPVSRPSPEQRPGMLRKYNIKGTPSSFLLDANGAIITKDPTPEKLRSILQNNITL